MNQTYLILIIIVVFSFLLVEGNIFDRFDEPQTPFKLSQGSLGVNVPPGSKSLQFGNLTFTPPASCSPGNKIAVDLVLDTSSSMSCANSSGDCKINSLISAVNDFATLLPDSTLIGVQTLQKRYIDFGLLQNTRDQFTQQISQLDTDDGTPTEKGLKLARDAIRSAKTAHPDYTNWKLILATDGCPDKNQNPIGPATEIKAENVEIFTIGIELGKAGKCDRFGGVSGAKQLMESISSKPDNYIDVESSDLDQKLKDIISKVQACS